MYRDSCKITGFYEGMIYCRELNAFIVVREICPIVSSTSIQIILVWFILRMVSVVHSVFQHTLVYWTLSDDKIFVLEYPWKLGKQKYAQ